MDEALSVGLVVDIFLAEGGEVFAVEGKGTLAPDGDDIAFVEFQAHRARDRALRGANKCIQGFAQRRKPLTVVGQFGVTQGDNIFVVDSVLIENQRFEFTVGSQQYCSAGSFVDAVGFHPDQAALD